MNVDRRKIEKLIGRMPCVILLQARTEAGAATNKLRAIHGTHTRLGKERTTTELRKEPCRANHDEAQE